MLRGGPPENVPAARPSSVSCWIVEIVFEIDTEADPAVLTATEAEADAQGAAQIGAAAIVVEGVAAASEQRGTTGNEEAYLVGDR